MKRAILMGMVIFFFTLSSLFAQWGPDVRLTDDPASSRTSYPNAWCITATGNMVHVVWYDERDGDYQIYYKRSIDEGVNWGDDTRLVNTTRDAWHPCVALSGDNVHVVWEDMRWLQWEVYYKRSTDGGTNWGAETNLSNHFLNSFYPSVAVSGDNVHVIWHDNRASNWWEIYYKRSTDGGTSWGAETRLTNVDANSTHSSIAVSGNNVHVVWWDDRDGTNGEIYYMTSTDGGTSWGAETRLTDDPEVSWYPSIAVSGNNVHVVWWDARDVNFEIYYKRSTNEGTNWESDTRLTDNSGYSADASVTAFGTNVYVVWWDDRDMNKEIYYKSSADGGTNWESDTRLTSMSGNSWYPSVAVSGTYVHVVWCDDRDANWEIYYKRNSVLGIETPSFSAIAESFYIKLQWRLEIEDACLQYLILKKSIKEDDDYFEIAKIPGSGSSPSPKNYFYRDDDVRPGIRYYYKLGVVKTNGNTKWYGPVSAVVTGTKGYLKVSPNPSRDKVNIEYCIGQRAEGIELKIYDMGGRLVKNLSLDTGHLALGTEVTWDGRDDYGNRLRSGIYFCVLKTNGFTQTEKVLLIKALTSYQY